MYSVFLSINLLGSREIVTRDKTKVEMNILVAYMHTRRTFCLLLLQKQSLRSVMAKEMSVFFFPLPCDAWKEYDG